MDAITGTSMSATNAIAAVMTTSRMIRRTTWGSARFR